MLIYLYWKNVIIENAHDININGINLEYVSSFKYLGVEIDRNLTMKSQYEYIFKAVNHKFFLLKLIRRSLTIKAALEVARSMIFSLIDYAHKKINQIFKHSEKKYYNVVWILMTLWKSTL